MTSYSHIVYSNYRTILEFDYEIVFIRKGILSRVVGSIKSREVSSGLGWQLTPESSCRRGGQRALPVAGV